MLIGSHSRLHYWNRTSPSGLALVTGYVRTNWAQSGRVNNLHTGVGPLAAVPVGYLHPNARLMPRTPGGIGSTQQSRGTAAITLNLAGGRNGEATLAGSGSIDSAIGQLVVSAVATITGSGAVTDADARAFLNAVAALAGSGDLDGAVSALGWATGAAAGTGAVASTPRADGELSADVSPFTDLSPQSLAEAVWSSEAGRFLYALGRNRVVTDPATGTYTVYDADDVTPLYTADLWADAAGLTPYSGSGAERRDRLV